MKRILFLALAFSLVAAPAHADPVTIAAAIITAVGITGTAATIATFVLATAIAIGETYLLNKLFAPKQSQQERQASVLTLTVGEVPRELALGRVASGGSLADVCNYGGTYGTDWEAQIVVLADHRCDALEGFWVNDTYVAFGGDGGVTGYHGQLDVYWRDGSPGQTFPAALAGNFPVDAANDLQSQAYVVVAYKADDPNASAPVWTAGRPTFLWQFRGALCYDPRKDSTAGGSGAHRWADPSTWEWSENAYVCRYKWVRGCYAHDLVGQPEMLLVGRGLSELEAPPANVFAAANICDEDVGLKAGGTEKRYVCSAVIRSNDVWITCEENFAACMSGIIIQPSGCVEIEPGHAKTPVASLTDSDVLAGVPGSWTDFVSVADRINIVVPRYNEPAQKWVDFSAPLRRVDLSVIADDGGPAEDPLSLAFVSSGTQAQRCGEAELRLKRLERSGARTFGPRWAGIEDGDWVEFTGARTGGVAMLFRVSVYSLSPNWRNTLQLQQVSESDTCDVWTWNPAADEITPEADPDAPNTPPTALTLTGIAYSSVDLAGVSGVMATWTPASDVAIAGVRLEVREKSGPGPITVCASTSAASSGVLQGSNGVLPNTLMEARLVVIAFSVSRATIPTSWADVTTTPTSVTAAQTVPYSGVIGGSYAPWTSHTSLD